MAFECFFAPQRDPDPQADPPPLVECVDGVMRSRYEDIKLRQRMVWGWIGWRLRPETDSLTP